MALDFDPNMVNDRPFIAESEEETTRSHISFETQQKENSAMKTIFLIPLFSLFFLLASCDYGPNSGRGFSLPEGNVDKGRSTFVELECDACHSVGDIERVAGREDPNINVVLGGRTTAIKTYGDLVTSVINPSHRISRRYANQDVATEEGESKMIIYNEFMTVQQLVDLVTYLESAYEVVPATRTEYARYRD
jgi:sulfur-oxidizing protein SoxX